MRVLTFFFSLAFLVFFGVGYWNGSRQPHPSLEEHIMDRLSPDFVENQPILFYRHGKSQFAAYDPKNEKLTTNIATKGKDTTTLANIDPKLLTLIGGVTLGLNVDSLASSQTLVRLLNRATGVTRKNRILGTILGGISGYSAGEYFGSRSTLEVGSDAIPEAIADEKAWKAIRTKYSAYRLGKLRISVDDLPPHVAEPYLRKINSAERQLIFLRSSTKENTFSSELALVMQLERDIEPHFRLMRGWWDMVWGDFLTQMKVFMYAFLGALSIVVVAISYSVLTEKVTTKEKRTKPGP